VSLQRKKDKPDLPLPLSVSIIASNEEDNLVWCLESLRDMAAEIVLVHNDCRDGTVEVAKEFGATCYEEPWHGHRDQKNIALTRTTQEWVLCLDADEALSPRLWHSIVHFIKSEPPESINGAYFNRLSTFLGKWIRHGDWYPDQKLRLVRNGFATWRGSREHDKLELLSGDSKHIKGDLLHYSYPNLNSFVEKAVYFSDIYLQRQLDEGKRWKVSHALVRPVWRFLRGYVIRRGFLDGFPGFFIAWATAYMALMRHSRLYEHNVMKSFEEEDPHQTGDHV
jgi:glycosyltransferase involved in cell wall biosynthesis